jgi:LPXTG-motif cell wall-anchored protein
VHRSRPAWLALGVALALAAATLASLVGGAGTAHAFHLDPHFDPAYVPALDDDGRPRRDSVAVACHPTNPERLVVTFQPWNGSTGWLAVTDGAGEFAVPAGEWPNGRSEVVGNRAGQTLHYWSGSSNDPQHPDGNGDPGHYAYGIVPGHCKADEVTPPPPADDTPPPVEEVPPPVDETPPPVDDTPPPVDDTPAPPPPVETPPPVEETPSPTTTVTAPTTTAAPAAPVPALSTASVPAPLRPAGGELASTGGAWVVLLGLAGLAVVTVGALLHGLNRRKAAVDAGPLP